MKKSLLVISVLYTLTLLLFLTACGGRSEKTAEADSAGSTDTIQPATQTEFVAPSPTVLPTLTPTPTTTPVVVLPPEPVQVEFQAPDGESLTGIYYPASDNPAPIIVLMDWARGDQSEWEEIAAWLQGRGQLSREPNYNYTWKSADWFPERILDMPLGVFTFTFRDCEEGCQSWLPAEWLLDARTAVEVAARLPGADPTRIITAGASIGGDGALDGCAWLDQTGSGVCRGSFTLSPASLLTVPYGSTADELLAEVPSSQVYCLYGLRDDASVETCEEIPGVIAVDYGYIENHGMELIQPDQNPDPLILLQEFILATVGEMQ